MTDDDKIDDIFNMADDAFNAGEFGKVDDVLSLLDPEMLGVDLCVAWLTVTGPAAPKLTKRAAFFDKVSAYFNRVEPERAIRLLDGLQ